MSIFDKIFKKDKVEKDIKNENVEVSSKTNNGRLSQKEIDFIRKVANNEKVFQREIADVFNISESHVSNIKNKKINNELPIQPSTEIKNARERLSRNKIIEIKNDLKNGELSQREISRNHNVSESTVSRIKLEKAYSDVKPKKEVRIPRLID